MYIFTKWVSGGSLQALVQSFGPLVPQVAARYIAQALAALRHLHSLGLVHRDVKVSARPRTRARATHQRCTLKHRTHVDAFAAQ